MTPEIEAVLVDQYGIAKPEIEDGGFGQGQTRRLKIHSGDTRYMAKHMGDGSAASFDSLSYECGLLAHLRAGAVPVAANLPTKAGASFAVVDGRPFVVYEWAEGGIEWPAISTKAAALGATVARMHAVSSSALHRPCSRVYDVERLIDRPLSLLKPFAPDLDSFDLLVKLTNPFRNLVLAIPIEPPFFGPIHGDIHQGNCHFQEGEGLTIVDFALCGIGYRAYDLTGFLWPMRDKTIENKAMSDCCLAFLSGYESVRPLHPAERDAIPAFVQLRTLWETGDWIDTGTGREQPAEVAKAIPYLTGQFEALAKSV